MDEDVGTDSSNDIRDVSMPFFYSTLCDGMKDEHSRFLEVDKKNDINLDTMIKNISENSMFAVNLNSSEARSIIIKKGDDEFRIYSKTCYNLSKYAIEGKILHNLKAPKSKVCHNCYELRRNSQYKALCSRAKKLIPLPLINKKLVDLMPATVVIPSGFHYSDLPDVPFLYDNWSDSQVLTLEQAKPIPIVIANISKSFNQIAINQIDVPIEVMESEDFETEDVPRVVMESETDDRFEEALKQIKNVEWYKLLDKEEDSLASELESNIIKNIAQCVPAMNKYVNSLNLIYLEVHNVQNEYGIKVNPDVLRNLALLIDFPKKQMTKTLINGDKGKKNNGTVKKETLNAIMDLATSVSYNIIKKTYEIYPLVSAVTIKRKMLNTDRIEHNYYNNVKSMVDIFSKIRLKMVKTMSDILTYAGEIYLNQKLKSIICLRILATRVGTMIGDGTKVAQELSLNNRVGQFKGIAGLGGCLSNVISQASNIKEKTTSNVKLEKAMTENVTVNIYMPAFCGLVGKCVITSRHEVNENRSTILAQSTHTENILVAAGKIPLIVTGDNLKANVAAFTQYLNITSTVYPGAKVSRASIFYRFYSNVFYYWLPRIYWISDGPHVLKAIINAIQNHETTWLVMVPITNELMPLMLNWIIDVVTYFESKQGNHKIIQRLRIQWAYGRKENSTLKMNVPRTIMLVCCSHELLWLHYIIPFILALKENSFEDVSSEMQEKMLHCLQVTPGWFELSRRIDAWFDEGNGRNVPLSKKMKMNIKKSYNITDVSNASIHAIELHRYISQVRAEIAKNPSINLATASLSTVTYNNLTLHIQSKSCCMRFLCTVFHYDNWCHKNFGIGDIVEQLFSYVKYLCYGPMYAATYDKVICKVMTRQVHSFNQLNAKNFKLTEATRSHYAKVGTGNSNGSDDDSLVEFVCNDIIYNIRKKNKGRTLTSSNDDKDIRTLVNQQISLFSKKQRVD